MRAYTLTVLAQCTQSGDSLATDRDIINWVNEKLRSSGKNSQIKSFQDHTIGDARPLLDLIDAIKPGKRFYLQSVCSYRPLRSICRHNRLQLRSNAAV